MKTKFFCGRYGIDYYIIPTIAIDYGDMYGSYKIFMVAFRFWVWEIGFTIFYGIKTQ